MSGCIRSIIRGEHKATNAVAQICEAYDCNSKTALEGFVEEFFDMQFGAVLGRMSSSPNQNATSAGTIQTSGPAWPVRR